MGKQLDLAVAILNGLVGDHLARTSNTLAIDMECRLHGAAVPLTPDALRAAYPAASDRLAVLVHGLMCTEAVWEMPDGTDYGALLARDVGMSPVYVRYNSGRSIPDTGAALATVLDALVDAWPVPVREIVPIGYSMGGLVVRAATHVAATGGARFLPLVRRVIYVGTPHRGAPLERIGRVVTHLLRRIPDPVTNLIGDIADLRSDGLKDLGDADVRHEDRARRRAAFSLRDPDHPVPLLRGIEHRLIAGSLKGDPRLVQLFGDSLVPVHSGTDGTCIDEASMKEPPTHVAYLPGIDHMTLARHPLVYERIRAWCDPREEDSCPA